MRFFIVGFLVFSLVGCSTSDFLSIAQIASSKDVSSAVKTAATTKATQYAKNPDALKKDLEALNLRDILSAVLKSAAAKWGTKDVEESTTTKTVKYIDNFQSRVLIDFDKGELIVATVTQENQSQTLRDAIVLALLMSHDPRQVDIFDSSQIVISDEPYLYNEVLDDQGKAIRYEWRAKRFADILIKDSLKTKMADVNGKSTKVAYVIIPMVKNHNDVRVKKFETYVKKYATQYNISQNLVYAIIRTESNFNQYAVSKSGAIGLMQIIPSTAGRDINRMIHNKDENPTKEYLFNAQNNIQAGVAYLHILFNRYVTGINNPLSQEYCVISAYNGGAGHVYSAFNSDRTKAKDKINSLSASAVYSVLRSDAVREETKNYLHKVMEHKKEFKGIN